MRRNPSFKSLKELQDLTATPVKAEPLRPRLQPSEILKRKVAILDSIRQARNEISAALGLFRERGSMGYYIPAGKPQQLNDILGHCLDDENKETLWRVVELARHSLLSSTLAYQLPWSELSLFSLLGFKKKLSHIIHDQQDHPLLSRDQADGISRAVLCLTKAILGLKDLNVLQMAKPIQMFQPAQSAVTRVNRSSGLQSVTAGLSSKLR